MKLTLPVTAVSFVKEVARVKDILHLTFNANRIGHLEGCTAAVMVAHQSYDPSVTGRSFMQFVQDCIDIESNMVNILEEEKRKSTVANDIGRTLN